MRERKSWEVDMACGKNVGPLIKVEGFGAISVGKEGGVIGHAVLALRIYCISDRRYEGGGSRISRIEAGKEVVGLPGMLLRYAFLGEHSMEVCVKLREWGSGGNRVGRIGIWRNEGRCSIFEVLEWGSGDDTC